MQKDYLKKKIGRETRVDNFKCIFRKSEDIVGAIYLKYSQIRRPLLGPFKCGRSWQVFSFFPQKYLLE